MANIFSALPALLTSMVIITTFMLQDKISTYTGLMLIFLTSLVSFVPIMLEYLVNTRFKHTADKTKQKTRTVTPTPAPLPPHHVMQMRQEKPMGMPNVNGYQISDPEEYAFMKNAGFIQ